MACSTPPEDAVMRRSLLTRLIHFSLLAVVTVVAISANAQDRPKQGGQQAMREPARGGGTIKGPAPGGLEVAGSGGERTVVTIDRNANPNQMQLAYYGQAETSWLRPGMIVRFATTLDKKGRMVEPISQLDVITLRPGYQIGVSAESGLNDKEGPGLFQDKEPEKPAKKPAVQENTPVLIIGRLTEIKNGKFSIAAGGRPMKGELAEATRVSIDMNDLSLAKAGDKIEYQGWSYPGMKQVAICNNITITGSEKLVGETKKKPPMPEAKEGDEKPEGKPGEKPAEKAGEKAGEKAAEKADK